MKTFGILALSSSLFLCSTLAAPLNKRDLVVVTVTDNVIETVDITTTVYVGADATSTGDTAATTTSAGTTTTSTPATSSASSSSSAAAAAPTTSPTSTYVAPTTSSTPAYVAPTTSSTPAYVAPTTTPSSTTTPAAVYTPPTSSSSPPPAATSSTPVTGQSTGGGTVGACSTDGKCSSSGTPCCGDITHYDTDAAHQTKGACGFVNDGATEDVVALPYGMMGTQSNGNPFCSRTVTVSLNGKTANATVVDKCMGCEGQSIDLSDHLFGQLGNPAIGRTQAQWWFTS
ncbi:MAG: hypothetical protein M1812_007290 [Candelaria pacifica]|nr:MAG: hypothetical protein M1812_007290 [Candelaria pacifica]